VRTARSAAHIGVTERRRGLSVPHPTTILEEVTVATIIRPAVLAGTALLAAVPLACAQGPVEQGARNAPGLEPAFPEQTRAPAVPSGVELAVSELAGGLVHPWGMALLPEGALLVTERPGRMRIVGADGAVSEPLDGVPPVHARDQGGLLDVAVGPDFAEDRMVYWTYSKPLGDGLSATAAASGRLSEDGAAIEGATDIFVQAPPSPTSMHYGSRVLFDGDGNLYVTTGEHSSRAERVLAQDLAASYGKVVRLRPDGSVPPDNPFVGEPGAVEGIWTFGHRNVQGAAIHPESGSLWIVEHGPRGGDELNLIEAGLNYGWPVVSYGVNYDGSPVGDGVASGQDFEEPVYFWDPVIAPGGMAFYTGELFSDWHGDLLIASLNPGALVRLEFDGGAAEGTGDPPRVTGEERLLTDAGRIRDVEVAPDGAVLVLTDQRDGAVLRLTPERSTN
jgi:aldose sugar dehydrogenase